MNYEFYTTPAIRMYLMPLPAAAIGGAAGGMLLIMVTLVTTTIVVAVCRRRRNTPSTHSKDREYEEAKEKEQEVISDYANSQRCRQGNDLSEERKVEYSERAISEYDPIELEYVNNPVTRLPGTSVSESKYTNLIVTNEITNIYAIPDNMHNGSKGNGKNTSSALGEENEKPTVDVSYLYATSDKTMKQRQSKQETDDLEQLYSQPDKARKNAIKNKHETDDLEQLYSQPDKTRKNAIKNKQETDDLEQLYSQPDKTRKKEKGHSLEEQGNDNTCKPADSNYESGVSEQDPNEIEDI